ncbi:hypothetical protein PtB15_4B755 [Puccinia triticina]|nr:hypothetical protein PtB15_4B755 [Puccinia triticina]
MSDKTPGGASSTSPSYTNETQNSRPNVCPLLSNNSQLTATPADWVSPHEPRISPSSAYKTANTIIQTRKLLGEELGLSVAEAEAINKLTGTFGNNNEEAVLHKVSHPFNASAPPMLAPASVLLNNPPASAWAIVIPQNLAKGPTVIPIPPPLSSIYPTLPPGKKSPVPQR